MKQRFFIMAAAALTLAACSNDENMEMTDGPVAARITAGLSAPTTRAIGTNWSGTEEIGVFVTNSTSGMDDLYKNVKYQITNSGATGNFTAVNEDIFFQDAEEIVTFAAYAPYQESENNETLPGESEDGVVDVKTDNMNTATDQEKIDFLFASGAVASRRDNIVSFADATPETPNDDDDHSFHHKMAQLNVVFQVSTNDGFAANQIFDGTFNLGGLIHEGTFNVTDGKTALTGEPLDNWDISGCKYTDAATTRTYSLILLPQELSSNPLDVAVTINGQTYRNNTTINQDLEPGNSYTYTITVKKSGLVVSGCTITGWTDNGKTGDGDAVM